MVWPDADLWLFGMLQSAMFMVWVKAMAGRMKSDISLSPDLTYSTFPFPPRNTRRAAVEQAAEQVLRSRAAHPDESLRTLYDPLTMPLDLLEAHRALDRAVDAIFGRGRFDDVTRLNRLLERYVEIVGA